MIGQTVSHYRIVEKLGGGGMGVVYRAEDTRLGRQVALKFLPDIVSSDPAALERFRREARAASSINHPFICTVYDVGEVNGKPFLAMELLNGSTLRDRLASGPIPVPQILEWGVQITDALESAHAAGIVHRDLKPANIFVTARGPVKVLDFGLAKVATLQAAGDVTMTLDMSAGATTPGTTMGTIAYMSPEQARGEELDGRSDIFSFGALLYEMATGRQAFEGRTPAVVFNSILSGQPPAPSSINPAIPDELEHIIEKCLKKDVSARYSSVHELNGDLRQLQHETTVAHIQSATGVYARRKRRFPRRAAGALIAVLIGVLVALGVMRRADKPGEIKLRRLTANPAERAVGSAVISDDAKYLAYSDPAGIRLLTLRTNDSTLLPGTQDMSVWGWDASGEKLLAMRQVDGDRPRAWLIPVIGAGQMQETALAIPSPDGQRAVLYKQGAEPWIQDSNGGPERKLMDGAMPLVAWSRDGALLAFMARTSDGMRLFVQDVANKTNHEVLNPQRPIQGLEWTAKGTLLFAWAEPAPAIGDSNLWEMPIDHKTGERTGEPRRITDWQGYMVTSLTASDNGKVAVVRVAQQTDVYLAELRSDGELASHPRRFTLDDRNDRPYDWTGDGKAILFTSDRNGSWDVMLQTLTSDSPQVLTRGPDQHEMPRLSPDGSSVIFASRKPAGSPRMPAMLMQLPLTGGITTELGQVENYIDHRCSRDLCTVETREAAGQRSVWQLDPEKGKGKLLFKRPGGGETALSHDGKLAAYIPWGAPNSLVNKIQVVRASDGNPEREITLDSPRIFTSLEWDAESKGFYAGVYMISSGAILLHIDLKGKTRELWQQPGTRTMWGIPSPSGKHLALYGATRDSNVWLLEGI